MNSALTAAIGGAAVVLVVAFIIHVDITERRKQTELAERLRQASTDAKARYDEWHIEERGR